MEPITTAAVIVMTKEVIKTISKLLYKEIIKQNPWFKRIVARVWQKPLKKEIENSLSKTIKTFENKFPEYGNEYYQQLGSPFYNVKEVLLDILNFKLFKSRKRFEKEATLNRILNNFKQKQYPIIPPSLEQLDFFCKTFIDNLSSKGIVRSAFIKENFENEIFEVSNGIESLRTDFEKQVILLESLHNIETYLQSYEDVFHKNLSSSSEVVGYQFTNRYINESNKLKTFYDFIDSKKNILIISADGGIGKTRLCVEFFKEYESTKNEYTILVTALDSLPDFERIVPFLEKLGKVIILIDDADTKIDLVAEYYRLANQKRLNGKIKIILTVREINSEIKKITHSSYEELLLKKLSPKETKELFKSLLDENFFEENYFNHLVDLSRGIPLLVLTLVDLIYRGKQISDINNDKFVEEFTLRIKDNLCQEIGRTLNITEKKVDDAIFLVALLGSISNREYSDFKLITDYIDLSIDEFKDIIVELQKKNFIIGSSNLSIKPDTYSDVVLRKGLSSGNSRLTKLFKSELYKIYQNKIIINARRADKEILAKKFEADIESKIEYLKEADISTLEIINVLEFISKLNYDSYIFKYKAIDNFLIWLDSNQSESLSNPSNALFFDKKFNQYYSLDSLRKACLDIFKSLFFTFDKADLVKSIYYLKEYINVTKDYSFIFECLGYQIFDSPPRNNFQRQLIFLDELEKLKIETENVEFIISSCQTLLAISFEEKNFFQPTGEYSISKNIVLYTKVAKEIRKRSINKLIELYNNIPSSTIPIYLLSSIHEIFALPYRFIKVSNPNRKKESDNFIKKYEHEFKVIIKFIRNICNDKNTQDSILFDIRKKLNDLLRYNDFPIKKNILEKLIDTIDSRSSYNRNLHSLLLNLPYKENELISWKNNVDLLLDKYSSLKELADDLSTFYKENKETLSAIINILDNLDVDSLKSIYDRWQSKDKEMTYDLGKIILQRLYRFYPNEELYFREKIEQLLKENTPASHFAVTDVFRIGETPFKTEDIKYLEKIISANICNNHIYISKLLFQSINLDINKGIDLIELYWSNNDSLSYREQVISDIPYYIKDKKTLLIASNALLTSSFDWELNSKINHALSVIFENRIDEYFDFVVKCAKYHSDNTNPLYYKKVIEGKGLVDLNINNEKFRLNIFKKSLNWLIHENNIEYIYRKDVLEYFLLGNRLSPKIVIYYLRLIRKYINDFDTIEMLFDTLSLFIKNKFLLHFVISAINLSIKQGLSPLNYEKLIERYLSLDFSTTNRYNRSINALNLVKDVYESQFNRDNLDYTLKRKLQVELDKIEDEISSINCSLDTWND